MKRNSNIVWVKASPAETAEKFTADVAFAEEAMPKSLLEDNLLAGFDADTARMLRNTFLLSLEEAAEKTGLPHIPDTTARQELKEWLLSAAEVEHGLMAMYLYAGSSCTDQDIRTTLIHIAVEEMGHLITVQNLLLAIGENPYLGRYDKGPQKFNPFPFTLEPVSRLTLAKYAACEMPEFGENINPEYHEILRDLLADAIASAGSLEPRKIGTLYAKIYWLVRENDEDLPSTEKEPWTDFPVALFRQNFPGRHIAFPDNISITPQAGESPWKKDAMVVRTVKNRIEALNAISAIVAQGEGFADESDSHFDQFVLSYRNIDPPDKIIDRGATSDPWYKIDGTANGKPASEITEPLSIEFSKLGDLAYEIVLLAITLAVHPDTKDTTEKRSEIGTFCIDFMKENGLRKLMEALPRLTLTAEAGSPKLMLCFRMPDLTGNVTEIRTRLLAALTAAEEKAKELQKTSNSALRSAAKAIQKFISDNRAIFDT